MDIESKWIFIVVKNYATYACSCSTVALYLKIKYPKKKIKISRIISVNKLDGVSGSKYAPRLICRTIRLKSRPSNGIDP